MVYERSASTHSEQAEKSHRQSTFEDLDPNNEVNPLLKPASGIRTPESPTRQVLSRLSPPMKVQLEALKEEWQQIEQEKAAHK